MKGHTKQRRTWRKIWRRIKEEIIETLIVVVLPTFFIGMFFYWLCFGYEWIF